MLNRVLLAQSEALHIPLPDKSVQCVVTSPPYYGLRDYQVEGQIGLEPTPEEYVANMVAVFREVRRVLRDDGVVWLNLGDSYAGSNQGAGTKNPTPKQASNRGTNYQTQENHKSLLADIEGLKTKDLIGIPWRVAFALQADGWYLRSDIVWHKPNPMPESVTDRPTKSHEYIFLLTKSARYFYDADAIREENADPSRTNYTPGKEAYTEGNVHDGSERTRRNDGFEAYANGKIPSGRNKRSVWTITTKPYSGAHFATFPPELPEICIKAGTSEKGCCPECGAAWERVVDKPVPPDDVYTDGKNNGLSNRGMRQAGQKLTDWLSENPTTTVGWQPTCDHNLEPIPQIVCDIFGGSGTTAMVANQLGRVGISLDLSLEYSRLAKERLGMTALEEFYNGKSRETNLENLPLFEESG